MDDYHSTGPSRDNSSIVILVFCVRFEYLDGTFLSFIKRIDKIYHIFFGQFRGDVMYFIKEPYVTLQLGISTDVIKELLMVCPETETNGDVYSRYWIAVNYRKRLGNCLWSLPRRAE